MRASLKIAIQQDAVRADFDASNFPNAERAAPTDQIPTWLTLAGSANARHSAD